jgi:hypothetical protein
VVPILSTCQFEVFTVNFWALYFNHASTTGSRGTQLARAVGSHTYGARSVRRNIKQYVFTTVKAQNQNSPKHQLFHLTDDKMENSLSRIWVGVFYGGVFAVALVFRLLFFFLVVKHKGLQGGGFSGY